MTSVVRKTVLTHRGFTYSYVWAKADKNLPTVLLCHGWPDNAALWTDLISQYLQPAGYGIIAPDCLGYGATDKPTDENAYAINSLCADIIQILDVEAIAKVIALGHDWGSLLAQRLYLFHPDRVSGCILMNVAYRPPSESPFDLNTVNLYMQSVLGYSPYWYWELVLSNEGPKLLESHLESLWTILHGSGESMIKTFGTKDGMKIFLEEDKTQEVQHYATDHRKAEFLNQFREGGMTAPLCWYKAQAFNIHFEAEKSIPKDLYVVNKPVLFIGGKHDKVGLTSAIRQTESLGLLPKLTVVEMDAAHWVMLAKPKEVGETILNWLEKTF